MHTFGLATTAIALTVLPGLLVGWRSRLPAHVAAVFSVPITFGMVGITTYVLGAAGIRWNRRSALVAFVVFFLLAWVYSRLVRRRRPVPDSRPPSSRRPPWAAVLGAVTGVAVGAGIIGYVCLRALRKAPGGLRSIPNGWDAQWHANVIAFIAETGKASPLQLGVLRNVETHAQLYYPNAWHALGALLVPFDHSVLVTFNVWSIVSLAITVPVAVGSLAWRLVRDRLSPAPAALAAGAAGAVAALFPALPYVEIQVNALPNAVSGAMAFTVAALVISCAGDPVRIPVAAIALVGLAAVHPSGALVAVGVTAVWWLCCGLWRPRRTRPRDLAALVAVGVTAGVVLLPQIGGVLSQSATISGFKAFETTERAASWGMALGLQNKLSGGFGVRMVLLGLAVLGAVVLLAIRSWWWLPLWVALVVATTNALMGFPAPWSNVLFTLTSSFYNDPHRITYITSMVVAALAGTGLALAMWGLRSAVVRWTPCPRPLAATLLGAGYLGALAVMGWHASTFADELGRASADDRTGRLLTERNLAAFDFLAAQPGARDTLIFNEPDQGTGWMRALNGLHPVFNHYVWPEAGPDTLTLWSGLDRAGYDPEVDAALRDLNVRYVIVSPPSYWRYQTTPPALTNLEAAPGLTKIYDDGNARIYEVKSGIGTGGAHSR
ncbi:hypothetical protein G4X40_04170 [Rhodococcus sp. D2-41]|uniref:Uncharacterized protein n=1 Tax=Speluncibacter jeojiensis TaxID=2710754 RepID=A0A9X4M2J0_9ACTN|nr:DUF6541 family protein [Rhodococcus sp. D2-41]MDG3009340.1 hypothetical protein [Rhodococcus sp. D2-41]MDG3016873.1 hypothetical protein [Corynebacteriales bacterium D3-21]